MPRILTAAEAGGEQVAERWLAAIVSGMRHYDANNFIVKTREQGSGFVADWRCRSCSSNGTTGVQLSEDRAELIAKLLAGMHDCPNAVAGDSAIQT